MAHLFKTWRIELVLVLLMANCSSGTAQTIIQSFAGVNYSTDNSLSGPITPPDTMGAAGTNQFVEFINGAFAVFTKSGVRTKLISDITFWENAGISASTLSAGLTDTRICYDPATGRWIASELTLDSTDNKVLVGRSDTSDPGGTWQAVLFAGSSSYFLDFDTLGVDSTGVYIGANDFDIGNNLTGVSFFSIPKADLLASPPTISRMTRFDNVNDQTYGFTLQGAVNPDPGPGYGVMLAIDNASFNYIDRTTINGSGGANATLSPRVRIHCTYDSYPFPARQPGGATIDTGDDRLSAAVKQVGGYIFMANSFSNSVSGVGRNAINWMVLNVTNNALVGEGFIGDATYDYYYPSIAVNHSGTILLGFNRSGTVNPAGDISIYAAVGSISHGSVTMGSPFQLKAGTFSNYTLSIDYAPYRWGDFSATMVDPTDENLFWTIQEIPASAASWGTQVTLISMATNPPTLGIAETGNNIQLSWPLSTDPAYVLQSTTDLASAGSWTAVSGKPVVSVNQNIVTLPATTGMAYYRLAK